MLDLAVAAALFRLLGWQWEFLPAFLAERVPGVDLVPFWTMAVINVYRKWKQITITTQETHEQCPPLKSQCKILRKPPQRTIAIALILLLLPQELWGCGL